MASIKISELEEVVTLSESDIFPIINEGDTKQVSISQLGKILATKNYVDETLSKLGETMGPTVEEYMRISDYLEYPKSINELNYSETEVTECSELIQFYAEMEETDGE